MVNKKAEGLSISVIIIAIIALVVLVVLIVIFSNKLGWWGEQTTEVGNTDQFGFGTVEAGGSCDYKEENELYSGTCTESSNCAAANRRTPVIAGAKCKPGLVCCS